jgi:hypothetical protein
MTDLEANVLYSPQKAHMLFSQHMYFLAGKLLFSAAAEKGKEQRLSRQLQIALHQALCSSFIG